jgi:hypothetical protein
MMNGSRVAWFAAIAGFAAACSSDDTSSERGGGAASDSFGGAANGTGGAASGGSSQGKAGSTAGKSGPTGSGGGALNPQLLAVTYVGGDGDQYIREVGFDESGNVVASAATFTVTYDAKTWMATVDGDISGADPEAFDDRWFGIGQELDDPRNGQHYSIGFDQVHPILQHPYVRSSAGWKLWDFSRPPHNISGEHLLDMEAADSRGYNIWLLPNGKIGMRFYTDGGNTFLRKDPHDPQKEATFTQKSDPGGAMSKGSVLYAMADPEKGELLSGVWVHKQRVAPYAVDDYGRAYNLRVATDSVPRPAENPFGHWDRSTSGLIVIDPTYTHYEFNAHLGGTCEEEGDLRQRFRYAAVRHNVLALGGITCARDLQTTANAVQGSFGGGNHDAMLMILKLWD